MSGGTEERGARLSRREIAEGVVQVFREHTGRDPRNARTYVDEDLVSVVLHDVLTDVERGLVERDGAEGVRQLRYDEQEAMRNDLIALIERETGREVAAFMSANHIEPDMAMESFVLAGDTAGA